MGDLGYGDIASRRWLCMGGWVLRWNVDIKCQEDLWL
jgi:hypothetical protein